MATQSTDPLYDEDLINFGYLKRIMGIVSGDSSSLRITSNYGTTPPPPYYVNDSYMEDGKIYICINTRLIGQFTQSDWQLQAEDNSVLVDYTTKVGLATAGYTAINGSNITTGSIQSHNYVLDTSGTKISLTDGTIDSKNFKVSSTGVVTATNGSFSGAITANSGSFIGSITSTSGSIGGFTIDAYNIVGSSGATTVGMCSTPGQNYAFWAGGASSGSAPFHVGHDGSLFASNATINGAITATSGDFNGSITSTSGTIGGFTLGSTSLSGSTTHGTMTFRRGSSASIDFPCNGGRLMLSSSSSSANVALTSAGGSGDNGMCISDSYSTTGAGATGYSIGIRALYGGIRMVCSDTGSLINIARTSGGSITLGTNVDIQGGYVRVEDVIFNGSDITANSGAIGLNATGSSFVWCEGGGLSSAKIKTTAGDSSSRNLKTNIKEFNNKKYNDAYKLLKKIKIYDYDYKYNMYSDKHQYGFIIDDLENENETKEFFRFNEMFADISNNTFNPRITDDKTIDKNNLPKNVIKYKEYDPDVLDKYLLTCIKALQNKIDELEIRLNKVI